MNNRKWLFGIMILVIVLLVAACGGKSNNNEPASSSPPPQSSAPASQSAEPSDNGEAAWNAIVAAAEKESFVVATGPGERDKAIIDAFQQAFPKIKVQHTGIRPTDIAPKVITEQENNKYLWDVMVGSSSTMNGIMSPAGVFMELPSIIKELPNNDDSNWHGPLEIYTNDKPEVLIHSLKPYKTIYINQEHELADQFKSIDDLVNPVFKGKIVIDTPMFPTYGSINLAGVMALKGEDFVKKIMIDQEPTYMDNIMTTTDWLGQKRFPIAIGADESRILELQRAGQCTKCEPFDYGAIPMLTQGVGIFKNNPNPNATKVFVNWLLGQEGQIAYNENLGLVSRRVDVENFSGIEVDWDNWQTNELIGTQKGSSGLNRVIEIYKSLGK